MFGPVLVVNTFSDEEKVLRRANDTEFGLYSSVFTSDISRALRVVKALEAGAVAVNCTSPFMVVDLPMGGWKQSGNLPYNTKPYEIEEVLATNGFGHLENIHISIDPVSARNPGYCFVDFTDRSTADHALSSLSATISGRPIRVGPCEPKKQGDRHYNRQDSFAFRRWGDWSATSEITIGQISGKGIEQGPYWALDHFDDMIQSHEARRLYVGGLGKMINQAQHNREITDLFAGFSPTAIGKRITPHKSTRSMPGNHHYCFIDFETKEETKAAMKALNGRPIAEGKLKVALAGDIPRTLVNRHTDVRYGRRVYNGNYLGSNSPCSENMAESNKALASSDWRRRGNE
ncbi:RNA recognition motif domain protein [Penicillium canescens]|nr:RNA recognition motif domain protein [Penicillium canescens]